MQGATGGLAEPACAGQFTGPGWGPMLESVCAGSGLRQRLGALAVFLLDERGRMW